MRQIPLRPVLIGLIVLVAAVGLTRVVPTGSNPPIGPSNSSASGSAGKVGASDGQCSIEKPGVSLVVDFGTASGLPAQAKCAAGFNLPAADDQNKMNGWQLFRATGISVAGTTEYPVGFVCRIAGYPAVADQPCTSTPTYAQGHWAYFYSQASDTGEPRWVLSGAGASMRKPECGSVEGWLFVKGDAATSTKSNEVPRLKPQAFGCGSQ